MSDDLWCMVCAKDIPPGEGICEMCACDMGRLRDNKQSVYDAAMVLLDKCNELGYESVYYPGYQLDLLLPHLDVLLDACSRAKEGR